MILERGLFSIYMIYYAQVWESVGKACPYLISLTLALTGTFSECWIPYTVFTFTFKMEEKGKQEIKKWHTVKTKFKHGFGPGENSFVSFSPLAAKKHFSPDWRTCLCLTRGRDLSTGGLSLTPIPQGFPAASVLSEDWQRHCWKQPKGCTPPYGWHSTPPWWSCPRIGALQLEQM